MVSYGPTLLNIEHLNLNYGAKIVLKDLNVKIQENIDSTGEVHGQVIGFIGPSGIGKCLGKGTPILMFDGSIKRVEDIVNGDEIMGPDSKKRIVSGVVKGRGLLFKVSPVKGESYIVNKEHILAVIDGRNKKLDKIEISVKDYLKKSKWFKRQCRGYRTGLINFNYREVPLNPYFIGLWLGDGSSDSAAITTADPEIVKFIEKLAKDTNVLVSKMVLKDNKANTYNIHNNWNKTGSYIEMLKQLNVLNNKHVPSLYKINSKEIRTQVLAGLMDSDGEYSNLTNCFTFTSILEILADDVCYLARSLGLAAYKKPFVGSCMYKGEKRKGNYFRVIISGNINIIPTIIKRKIPRTRKQIKNVLHTGIKVTPVGVGNYYGFELDQDKLFVLGDFTVTHNTSLCRLIAGLDKPSSGLIRLNGNNFDVRPGEVGVIAQSYPLFNHRTIKGNLLLAAQRKEPNKSAAMDKIHMYMNKFNIAHLMNYYPAQLSGGERQRVAISQQILCSSHFLIMDEPFSGLDMISLEEVASTIRDVAAMDGLNTIIIVTHDITSAAAVSDHLWMMGRDKDLHGTIIPGAKIVKVYDLIASGIAWKKDIITSPLFTEIVRQVKEDFRTL